MAKLELDVNQNLKAEPDRELQTMRRILRLLEGLAEPARKRVVDYLLARFTAQGETIP